MDELDVVPEVQALNPSLATMQQQCSSNIFQTKLDLSAGPSMPLQLGICPRSTEINHGSDVYKNSSPANSFLYIHPHMITKVSSVEVDTRVTVDLQVNPTKGHNPVKLIKENNLYPVRIYAPNFFDHILYAKK